MFDNELTNEKRSEKALDKYGPDGLAGKLNQHNLQINNGVFKMPHTFNGFGVTGYKDGGIIKGPGTGTSDSIPAKLPVESAIIPAHIVKLYGKDYFDKLEAAAPKSGGTKGKVDAKISNGEYQLSPDAVKYWGQHFITKLIGSDNEASEKNDSPSEESAEMQHYAEGGVVKPGQQPPPQEPTLFQKMFGTGTGPTPLDVLHGALSGKPPTEKPKGYADGGIVEDQPGLRERALNTADSNAKFRQRNPDFGARFAQSNAPQPSLRERLGMPVTQPPEPEPSLRERLGMPPRTEPIQRAPLGQPVVPNAPAVGGIRGAFNGAMQGLGSSPALATGLASTVLSDPAVAAGRDNAIAGLKQKAGIPADDTPYKFAKGGIVKPCYADGTASVGQEYADAGIPVLDNLANKVKGVGKAVMSPLTAVRNASNVDPNAMRIQPKKPDAMPDSQGFGAKPNPVTQPAPAAEQPNPQPAPNPTITPQNQYDSALIPNGNRLQLTPEYNAQLNAKDTRTVAQRDASNATPEQITGVQQRATALPQGGLGAYQRSNDNGGAFPVASKAEQDAYWNSQAEGQRLETLASKGRVLDPYTKQYLGQQTPNNYPAENQIARDTLNQNVRKDNLDREAASSTAAAQQALEREKLNRDQFGAINEKQYDDMGTVKGETARIWNKTTGQFVNADAGALHNKYQQQAIDALNSGDAASQEHAKTYLMQYFPKVYQKMFGKSQG